MRVETIGRATLYCGDAREIVPMLDPVDLVCTDPPYLLTYGGHHGSFGGKLSSSVYDNKGGIVECAIEWSEFMPLIFEVLKPDSHAYIMANNRHVRNLLNSAANAGLKFHNLLVWDKGTATANRWYMKNLEFTGFFYKGKAFFINDCGSKQLIRCPNILNSPHPTEKPIALMAHYISNSTTSGAVVLDPFMGVGSTGVAAIQMGRDFVGCEIETKYFDIACRRIEQAQRQGDMFLEAVA
ncbi:methyltransferase [Sphingobium sp. BS19]|nr:methyltransferase [Sphingobium sp. BS19]